MGLGTLLVLALLVGFVYLAMRSMKHKGGCCSCNGQCAHCKKANLQDATDDNTTPLSTHDSFASRG